MVEKLLSHIETPALVDLLMRIIQCDGLENSAGILDVCVLFSTVVLSLQRVASGFPQKGSYHD